MEKPGAIISVVGEDKALAISRAIIQTHKYVLENIAILTDRERGYMFNEYFPVVRDYLIVEPLEPYTSVITDAGRDEVLKVFTGGKAEDNPVTEEFKHGTDVQVEGVFLSNRPAKIKGVYLAKSWPDYKNGNRYEMIPTGQYITNLTTGEISFPEFFFGNNWPERREIYKDYGITDYVSICVMYEQYITKAPYQVGEDGEKG